MKKTLIIIGLMIGLLVLVGAKYDYLLEMGDKTVKSSECNECHKTIYKEWSQSYHAKAYVNDPFKQATRGYQEQACIPCHAAQEIAEENALKLRPVHREEGINCTTCHLRNNMIYGPYKLVAKHPSEQDESMLTAEFCAGCHMPSYQEWQASGSQRQCQECHMPRVERKSVQGFPLSALVPKRMVGQHIQMYEELLKGAASITGEIGAGSIRISLTNKAADHNMPTGKYGDYRVVLTTAVSDPGGATIFSKQEVFSTQEKTGIPFQKTMVFEYPLSLEAGKVSATLTYQVQGRPDRVMATWSAPLGGGT
jgi:nitrate/TMAO reductase-like tetraheme cytochrome c subunit